MTTSAARPAYNKPIPNPDLDSKPFWEAAREHRFVLQHCQGCGRYQHYPRILCTHCASTDLEWREASGKGTVYSVTVVYRAPSPAFQEEVPYAIALIDLAEGPRMMSNIVDIDPEAVAIGMPVEVVFDDITEYVSLPKFRPAKE